MFEISKILFWIANSLLIPDIILLILLFLRSLLYLGAFYNQFTTRLKIKKKTDPLLWQSGDIDLEAVKSILPSKDNSIYIKYLRKMTERELNDGYIEFVLSNFENEAEKDLITSKLLSKLGPVLGLIGTLIAMSPALVGLSTGDISGMAYNMQVVFATTVVGLIVSAIGLFTLHFKKRWYANEVSDLEYLSQLLAQKQKIS
ncbi:MAG: MotA/TolQ/ExbB proton channel family protein [Chitinophagales bacterium]|nr:MotA/TolQ/ExbB proton channel family protein [Chitinophagales bacterium]